MGHIVPILTACAVNVNGNYIFRTPANLETFPYAAYLMYLLTMFCLLWNVPLNPYPSCFRRLPWPFTKFLEFLVAVVFIELGMIDFWCPLHTKLLTYVSTIPDYLADGLSILEIDDPSIIDILDILKSPEALDVACYLLSAFFLICIAHSTRVIDVGLLRCGIKTFFTDVRRRSIKFARGLIRWNLSNARGCQPSMRHPPRGCRRRRSSSSAFDTDSA